MGVYVKRVVGGAERLVAKLPAPRGLGPALAWSHDLRWLIVAANIPTLLYRVSIDSGETRPLTFPCEGCEVDGALSLSSDRRTLAFLRAQSTGLRDVYALDLDEQALPRGWPRRLTQHASLISDPIWLPGGRRIAYASIIHFHWSWYSVDSRGGRPEPLADFELVRPALVFSPDGRRAVHIRSMQDYDIRAASLGGGPERELIASTRIDTNPHISPDGRSVVFASDRRGNIDIWKAKADGSDPAQLATFPGKASGTPRWSPDGKMIAFDVTSEADADIYVMNADGSAIRPLTTERSRDFVPSWSQDGQFIYFGSNRSGPYEIWRVPVAGGAATKITRNGGYGANEALDGRSLYVTKFSDKRSPQSGIWRVNLSDGSEERLVDAQVAWSRISVARSGLYFIEHDRERDETLVKWVGASGGPPRVIRRLEQPMSLGFSVARDEKWFVYSGQHSRGADLTISDVRYQTGR
jgi:Tol biopolymer transport system component